MQLLHTSYLRKASAFFFVLLFIVPHAVKVSHTHALCLSTPHSLSQEATMVKAGFSCTICQFQLAEDTDMVEYATRMAAPNVYAVLFVRHISSSYTALQPAASGTDPPRFA